MKLNVLLVEDSKHDVVAFKRAFKNSDIELKLTALDNGSAVLDLIEENIEFDIAVIDYMLPKMTGLELGKALLEKKVDFPLVLLTGMGNETLAVEALKAGIHDYIVKDAKRGYLRVLPLALADVQNKYSETIRRKIAEKQLKKEQERLKILYSILRHDLTNEFLVIHSFLKMSLQNKNIDKLDEALNRTMKGLDIIKKINNQEKFVTQHKDLQEYNLLEILKEVTANYNVVFNIEGEGQIYADHIVTSVFDNIINNAIKHGKTDRIDIKIEKDKEHVQVIISDYGLGILDNIILSVFDKGFFYGDTGHTGMGLHIVKETMQEYGGFVKVRKHNPQGTTFVLGFNQIIKGN